MSGGIYFEYRWIKAVLGTLSKEYLKNTQGLEWLSSLLDAYDLSQR
jgi:hypothetical protein